MAAREGSGGDTNHKAFFTFSHYLFSMIEKLIEERMVELAVKAWRGDYEEIIKLAEASYLLNIAEKRFTLKVGVNILIIQMFLLRFIQAWIRLLFLAV